MFKISEISLNIEVYIPLPCTRPLLSHTVTHLLRTPQFCRYGLNTSTEFEKSQTPLAGSIRHSIPLPCTRPLLSHTVTHLLRTPQFCRYDLTISTEFEKSQKLLAASNKSITHV